MEEEEGSGEEEEEAEEGSGEEVEEVEEGSGEEVEEEEEEEVEEVSEEEVEEVSEEEGEGNNENNETEGESSVTVANADSSQVEEKMVSSEQVQSSNNVGSVKDTLEGAVGDIGENVERLKLSKESVFMNGDIKPSNLKKRHKSSSAQDKLAQLRKRSSSGAKLDINERLKAQASYGEEHVELDYDEEVHDETKEKLDSSKDDAGNHIGSVS